MKKKLFLIVTFIITAVLVLVNVDEKEVKAETSCDTTTYYNYYLFLDATPKDYLLDYIRKYGDYITSKGFDLGIPSGSKNIKKGLVSLNGSSVTDTTWTLKHFYDKFKELSTENEVEYYTNNNSNYSYAMAFKWKNSNGADQSTSTALPDTFEDFKAGVTSDFGNPEINNPMIWDQGISGHSTFDITRTWDEEEIENATGDSGGIIWSPAVYYVSYEQEDCQSNEGNCYKCTVNNDYLWGLDPAPGSNGCIGGTWERQPGLTQENCGKASPQTYTIDVEFLDKDTKERIYEGTKIVQQNVPSGTSYKFDCSNEKFAGYSVYANENEGIKSLHEGTVTGDATLKCYYTPATTYKLTVRHYEDGNTNKAIDSDHVKDGYISGEEYNHQCKNIPGYSVVNTNDKPSLLTGTFGSSDVIRNCYYTKGTYTLTVNYGEDEDCSGSLLKNSDTYELKYNESRTLDVPGSIGKMNSPKLGTYSSQFATIPELNGEKLNVTMPAKNVEICIVYTPQTGASWIYLAWIVGILALGYSTWYFVRYYKKQNNEI